MQKSNFTVYVDKNTHIELQVISMRQNRQVGSIAGEVLDSLFETLKETPTIKVADVQTLKQQVQFLESQIMTLSAQLEAITKLPALNPPEPSVETVTEESDVHGDLSSEVVSETDPAVQEASGEDEAPGFVPEY